MAADGIDQDIYRPKGACDLLPAALKVGALHHIAGDSDGCAAFILDAPGCCLRSFDMANQNGDPRAGLRASRSHSASEIAAATGDDGGATSHVEKRLQIKSLWHISFSSRRRGPIDLSFCSRSGFAWQRHELEALVRTGQAAARSIQHAHILLNSDTSMVAKPWTDTQLRDAYGVSERTVWRVRQRFVEQGLHHALHRRPQPERPEKRKINGELEAHLIATVHSPAPQGYARWSVRLLADAFVVLEEQTDERVAVSRETFRRVLKQTNLSRG